MDWSFVLLFLWKSFQGFPDSSVGEESACNVGDSVWFLGWEDPWRRDRLPTPAFLGFPCGSAGKESACNVGDLGLTPGLGRSPGEGKGYPFQYKESDMTEWLSLSLFSETPVHFYLPFFYGIVCLFYCCWFVQSVC